MVIHNDSIDNRYNQKRMRDAPGPIMKMSLSGASTMFSPVSRVIITQFGRDYT